MINGKRELETNGGNITHLQQFDVFIERGRSHDKTEGNRMYRDLINSNIARYVKGTLCNEEKKMIAVEIVEAIEEKGRFLFLVKGRWHQISREKVISKVKKAINDAGKKKSSVKTKLGRNASSSTVSLSSIDELSNTSTLSSLGKSCSDSTYNSAQLVTTERTLSHHASDKSEKVSDAHEMLCDRQQTKLTAFTSTDPCAYFNAQQISSTFESFHEVCSTLPTNSNDSCTDLPVLFADDWPGRDFYFK